MTHRSNQAVASQGQAASQTALPPPPARVFAAWAMAIAAFMVSLALVGGGVWLVRLPLAHFILSGALSERGLDADFDVAELGLNQAILTELRVGDATAPDARIDAVDVRWRWAGIAPRLETVRLLAPSVRLRLDRNGRVSAGVLDDLRGQPARRRPSIPALDLTIESGRADIETPAGLLRASFEGGGVLGDTFSARGRIAETSLANGAYALQRGSATFLIDSDSGALSLRVAADAQTLTWAGSRVESASVRATSRAPLNLAHIGFDATWRTSAVTTQTLNAENISGALRARIGFAGTALTPETWDGALTSTARRFALQSFELSSATLDVRGSRDTDPGRFSWRIGSARFAGVGLISQAPSAVGDFTRAEDGGVSGGATITLNEARLSDGGQRTLRAALPKFDGAPIGPTFARAHQALANAGGAFNLTVQARHAGSGADGHSAWVAQPVEARAASGTILRLSALRDDGPPLQVRWPALSLSGALALELSGGGAPETSLLLDTVSWTPEGGADADGTLTLSNWRTETASISAAELGLSASMPTHGGGRIDLNGPIRVSGPLGDGAIRDLDAALDLAVTWDARGWRAAPADGACQNVRMARLEAAGLAFVNSAFALCPLDGALIAANARGDLAGGFSVRQLALNGRMAGPAAQPARLAATNVMGRFSGRPGAVVLNIDARDPTLAIDLAPERRLSVALRRATAQARVTQSWQVEGAFEQGALSDPNLPGTVTAIAGTWSAAPEENKPVIRVAAGEALLTAHPPATTEERPLFQPLRLTETTAELRDGDLTGNGAIVLVEGERRLARFTARHDVSEGAGQAQIVADNLVFGPTLQPYMISEHMRGLIENVRGPALVTADIEWTNAAIAARGRVRLDGVSLATSTIPVVEDVRGEVLFDDLFLLTTPPGQFVTVGLVNPGVAVTNGQVRFQLLSEQRVAIEEAAFDFASGKLAMAPTTITLGADESRFNLTLRDVDAATLIANLSIPDLAVTGRIEGDFPLLLTRRSAFIQNGVLRAQGEGGTIAYTGNAGAGATGAGAIAFDALRSFRYDALELTLDGDLSGEVVSSILFSGENSGRTIDLGPIAPIPGVGGVSVRGVPFAFNVRVTAPFSRLARTLASMTDPGALLENAQDQEQPETVDPAPAPPG